MENDLQEADVLISAVEFTNWGLKIKDEKGLVFNIAQFKKGTEQETVAFQELMKLPKNGMGLKKRLKFASVANSQGGNSRYVRMINDIDGQSNIPNKGEQIARAGIIKEKTKQEDDKWAEIAWGKCKFGFLIEAFKINQKLTQEVEVNAEEWASASVRKLDLPFADFGETEEIITDNIPF